MVYNGTRERYIYCTAFTILLYLILPGHQKRLIGHWIEWLFQETKWTLAYKRFKTFIFIKMILLAWCPRIARRFSQKHILTHYNNGMWLFIYTVMIALRILWFNMDSTHLFGCKLWLNLFKYYLICAFWFLINTSGLIYRW